MYSEGKIWIGNSDSEKIFIYPKMANRHGLIAGATGTGKTVSLKVLAESFSDMGVPVFLGDIKGDLSGLYAPGSGTDVINQRIEKYKLAEQGFDYRRYPVSFWDVYGEAGIPLRTTISEMGPLLLSRVLGLTKVQSEILAVVFQIADDEGLLLLDIKDLKSMLSFVSEHASEYSANYGNMTKQSLAAIVRALVALETEGANLFFGEPALNLFDWFRVDENGRGYITILECQKLITSPKMYSSFMLWMLSELYESLPEVGDLDKPKMVFFFDEAHMLFDSADKELLEKIEQVVKLIRSKGIGIYFVTQNPKDIPDAILSQLGNKIQHALRAYTESEIKGAKLAAASFRANPEFNTFDVLKTLGTGQALVSVLDEEGIPTVVKVADIMPPQSYMGQISVTDRNAAINSDRLYANYFQAFDRESAYERLEAVVAASAQAKNTKSTSTTAKSGRKTQSVFEKTAKSAVGTAGSTIGREIGKSIVGNSTGSFGKRLAGNVGSSIGRGLLRSLLK